MDSADNGVRSLNSLSQIRAEARDWVLRFNADQPPSKQDIEALRQWATQSPAHRQQLAEVQALYADADHLAELAVPVVRGKRSWAQLFNRLYLHLIAPLKQLAPLKQHQPAAIAASVLLPLVALVALFSLIPGSPQVGNGIYQTAIGEQRLLLLEDNSQIQLDTHSRVHISYSQGRREIRLLQGKAHFDVAKNPQRPFEVHTDQGLIRAVGTAFTVQLKQRAIEVMVDEGQVDLARPAITLAAAALTQPEPESTPPSDLAHRAPADSEPQVFMSLTQGQSASFNQDQQQMRQLAHNQLLQQQAWRRGLLIFADTPLSQVIEEIGRYTPVTIEIVDPELNNLALGGRFRIGELDALFDVLEAGFGIQISYIDQEHIQLRQFKH